jgi:hypothetical protein
VAGALCAGLFGALAPAHAGATSATATLTGGSLAFVTSPPAISFSATLDGTSQTATATQPLDVGDATGSGAGWNLTATSTTFTAGSHTLPAPTIQSAPDVSCDAGVTCSPATLSGITYPYTLPAGTTAPAATKLFNAAANTGMGDQTVTPTWQLPLPANSYGGTYTSTWTLSLVSAP